MFVYGGGSVKRNGCHDDIVQTLTDNGIPLMEYGDSSCEFAQIQEGIRIAKENGITMIIGAADIHLTEEEVKAIDTALDTMQMSEVFGGSPIKQQ